MIRSNLCLSKAALTDERVAAVWKAIDEDESGFISVGEFGRLMKRASPKAQQTSTLSANAVSSRRRQLIEDERMTRQQSAKLAEDARLREASRRADAKARALEEEAIRLELELQRKSSDTTKQARTSGFNLRKFPTLSAASRCTGGQLRGSSDSALPSSGATMKALLPAARSLPQLMPPPRIGPGVDF